MRLCIVFLFVSEKGKTNFLSIFAGWGAVGMKPAVNDE
jgi:hypothetical protein